MWKTGTSSGRRDAWAVGHNHRFAVGVWVGDFTGQGHVDLVGALAAEPLLAALFASPMLRTDSTPEPHRTWAVTRPLSPPVETADKLCITSPADGAIYLANGDFALIAPRVRDASGAADAPLTWYVNGIALPPGCQDRLELPRGQYELRCADHAGRWTAVTFVVR
jgi:membrane carboxypeptidase/penicillin-binding protein PbpC